MSKCRSCQAEIIWGVFEATGKRSPFDAMPVVGGNIILYPGDPPRARVVEIRDTKVPLYMSHFATCPQAEQHRQARI